MTVPPTNETAPSPTKMAKAMVAVAGRSRDGGRRAMSSGILGPRAGTVRACPICRRAVAAVLAAPADAVDPGRRSVTVAAGIPFSALTWGDPADRPLLLIHGITASARIWWRVGPALAASGRRVVAVDLPGHGQTGHWTGPPPVPRHRGRRRGLDPRDGPRRARAPDRRSQLGRDGHRGPAGRRHPARDPGPARAADDPSRATWRSMASDTSGMLVPGPRDGRPRDRPAATRTGPRRTSGPTRRR